MKLPYLILATLMPDSLAPSRLPPTATVCSPHLVRVSTTWKIATRMTAQMIADQAYPPVTLPKNLPMLSAAAGTFTGSAWDVVSMTPIRMNPVPTVVMNDGTPSVTVRKPLTQPTTTPMSRATTIAGITGTP